jgi:Fibronectin type III domain
MTTVTKPKPIKAVLGFSRLAPVGLQERVNAVLDGVYADPGWTSLTPPIDKATFKAAGDSYSSLSTAALDGSKKAIAARNHQGQIVVKMLKQLAHWVEGACNDDLKTFLASGFQHASTTPTKAAPLTESIRKIEPGPNPGQMKITLKDDPNALAYELQWSQVVANGAVPTWTSQHIGLTRPPTIISGLIPGASYVFQVRSITKTGAAAWGDPITRICT